ncbi:hypothetical protein ACFJIX_22265 [Roseateles sp. UC29_93]|uniref:hypothetical protein n=1 Tax=Roseateles sp. UC29_93 TaxID=3350177 RepID=UPI003670808D
MKTGSPSSVRASTTPWSPRLSAASMFGLARWPTRFSGSRVRAMTTPLRSSTTPSQPSGSGCWRKICCISLTGLP